jgi:hypothetical protein
MSRSRSTQTMAARGAWPPFPITERSLPGWSFLISFTQRAGSARIRPAVSKKIACRANQMLAARVGMTVLSW